jgi:hypothetical protein
MSFLSKQFLAVILITCLLVTLALADAPQLINYQGRLTDSDGSPVADGDYQITFTIYDGGGGSQWTSGEQTVHVSNGLFNYMLGSPDSIPKSVFENSVLYLGIKVGDDPEMAPKTLLTSAPSAAIAHNLWGGSVETNDESLVLKNVNGDSAMVFIAGFDSHIIRLYPPDPTVPPDPSLPAIELYANNENRIDVYFPDEEADAGIVQLVASPTVGGFISIHAAEPLLGEKVRLGGSIMDTGFIRLYGGGHATEYPLLEMIGQTEEGGRISFFDPDNIDGREMLTIGSSPAEGWSIVGFNPQPEPPGIPAFEMGINSAKAGPGSYFRLNNPLTEYLDEPLITMTTSPSEGGQIKFFNMAPSAGDMELLKIGTSSEAGIEIVGFNPQPEPPGSVAFELTVEGGSKGPGGRIAVYNPSGPTASMEGGFLELKDNSTSGNPNVLMEINSSHSQFNMFGVTPPLGGDPPVISMMTDNAGAFVSIGTDSMPEVLTVMGNGWFSGDVYTLTLTKVKKNITPIDNALELVSRMNGYFYDCRTDEYPSLRMPEKRQIGFLAEEVKEVVPEIVGENDYGLTGVDYSRISALLVEAVKELKVENEELRKRIEQLELQ